MRHVPRRLEEVSVTEIDALHSGDNKPASSGGVVLDLDDYRPTGDSKQSPESPKPFVDERVVVMQDSGATEEAKTEAFSSIYGEFAPIIKNYATSMSGSKDVAEEIAQESLINVWSSIERFESHDEESLRRWIFKIARNKGLNYIRNEKKHRKVGLDLYQEGLPEGFLRFVATGPKQLEPEEALDEKEEMREAIDSLKGLTASQRQAFTLSLDGLSYDQIAQEMGRTHPSIKSLISRAREKLSRSYEQYKEVDLSTLDSVEDMIDEGDEAQDLGD